MSKIDNELTITERIQQQEELNALIQHRKWLKKKNRWFDTNEKRFKKMCEI